MSAAKSVTGLLLFAKPEASYGAGAVISSSNAIQVAQEFPVFQIEYAFDGNRNGAQWSGGSLQRAKPGGRSTQGTVIIEGKGLGSTYNSGSTPPNLHAFLLASGLSGSVSGSGWLYTPTPLGTLNNSIALEVYDRGEKLPISGAYANMSFGADGAGLTLFTFALQGMCADITDAPSPPARSFTAANIIPPKNENISFKLGTYEAAKVRSYNFEGNINISPRINLNETDGHSGFAICRRSPTLNVTIEADLLSNFDAYAAWKNATSYAISLRVGTDAGNRFTIRFAQAQISQVERSNEDPVALWNLTFTPSVSSPDKEDDVSIYFD